MKPSELIDSPEKWIKGQSRANEEGFWVRSDDPAACKFCMLGALEKCGMYSEEAISRINKAINRLFPMRGWDADFNDSPDTTHADVLAVLKEAGL